MLPLKTIEEVTFHCFVFFRLLVMHCVWCNVVNEMGYLQQSYEDEQYSTAATTKLDSEPGGMFLLQQR